MDKTTIGLFHAMLAYFQKPGEVLELINSKNNNDSIAAAIDSAQLVEGLIKMTGKSIPGAGDVLIGSSLGWNLIQASNQLLEKHTVEDGTLYSIGSDFCAIASNLAVKGALSTRSPLYATLAVAAIAAGTYLNVAAMNAGHSTEKVDWLKEQLSKAYQDCVEAFGDQFKDIIDNIEKALENMKPGSPSDLINTLKDIVALLNPALSPIINELPTISIDIEKLINDKIRDNFVLPMYETPESVRKKLGIDPANSNTYRIVWLSADPLTLDLDGDGIETTAVNGSSGPLFDHNNDGISTATGWLTPDDGFLVRDINGNGVIDSGAELFGDSTLLSGGGTAANGFAALADLDTNSDGVVDASDAAFSQLRVWRDLNQDGVSQSDELFTLEQQGIQSLATAITSHADIKLAGGVQAETGSYTRLDANGNPVAAVMGDVNLRQDPFYSHYTDHIEIPEELQGLPDLPGMGRLRNLQEAAALSPALADVLTQYAAAQTRTEQRALLDQVLLEWAKSDPLYTEDPIQAWFSSFGGLTYDENSPNIIYRWRGQPVGVVQPTEAEPELLHRVRVLDAVLGRESTTTLNEGYASQVARSNRGYDALADAVYESLLTQTRLKKYLDGIDLLITEDTIELDLSGITAMFNEKITSDPVNGTTDLIEFNRVASDLLRGTPWDGYAMLEETLRTRAVTPELQEVSMGT